VVRRHLTSCPHCREVIRKLEGEQSLSRNGGRPPDRGPMEGETPESVDAGRGAPGAQSVSEESAAATVTRGIETMLYLGALDEVTEPGTLRANNDQPAPSAGTGNDDPSARSPLSIPGYEVLRELGRGGMGVVYEAIDRARNARVALKTVRQKDPAAIYRFKQ